MTITETVDHFARYAQTKAAMLSRAPLGFAISAMKAGAYVGLGIILIFSVGQEADPSFRALVMGASFGIALTLVVFAGSDLFTGHAMYGAHAWLTGRLGVGAVLANWAGSWGGNLAGALLVAALFVIGGGGVVLQAGGADLLHAVAAKKMHGGALELVARGMLCNWLVCLAIWTAARTRDDAAKCILIFWCLFAFIAAGFEHSVANMTVFSVALMSEHGAGIDLAGAVHNLFWVTLGNLISGVVIMGAGYWIVGGCPRDGLPEQAALRGPG
ncbi:MAG: nitrite transporter NirC [Alphaproteobacteria bacterium HGW-Alphaproteobacteria-3]|nr:MAG: nitrite transporter NirC [Alphaproteobacteria bacterium HGW-Alphaproteobacteria-3]